MNRSLRDRLVIAFSRYALRALASTWRVQEEVPDDCMSILKGEEPAVIVFWHGGMLPVWFRFRNRNYSALVSGSRDGEILSNYLQRSLGYTTIRGSSSRGGSEALAEIVEALCTRSCLITPDGPRGPVHEAKAGALIAAQRSGRKVLVAGWSSSSSWRFRSWDSMRVPRPFARIKFRYCIFDTHSTNSIPATEAPGTTADRKVTSVELARLSTALDVVSSC
jgi:lysophospholipid acyltransferase (LPLAT)-like uncharacterized protein